jgi:ATP-dependent DNA helicase RecG
MLTASQILELLESGEGYNVDFKRSVPSKVKEISDEVAGFANAAGGYVIIGVDNDNRIVGTEIDNNKRSAIQDTIGEISPTLRCDFYSVNVEGKKVWVIDVPSGKDKPYITGGVIYVREGANCQKLRSAEEIRAFFAECAKIYYDAIPCRWFDIDKDIEPDNFHTFMGMANLSDTLPVRRLFENLDLLTEGYVPKNAAALFFGREPERKFPHAVIRCLRFKGLDKVHIIDDKTFGGPLYQQYLNALSWLESKLEVEYVIKGTGPRQEIWEIPLDVFKESIMNAICHRDLYEEGGTIMVEVYDDRVEISNPGGLLPVVAAEFGHKSMSRNPLIFGLFTRMQVVEKVGSGIPRMRRLMKEAELPEPKFSTQGIFTVTFMKRARSQSATDGTLNDTLNGTLNSTEQMVFDCIKATPGVSANALIQQTDKSVRTIRRVVKQLIDSGLVEYRGSKKTGGYFVLPDK